MSASDIIHAMLAARDRIPRDWTPVIYLTETHPWFDVAELLADRFGRTPTLQEVADEIRSQGRDPTREMQDRVREQLANDNSCSWHTIVRDPVRDVCPPWVRTSAQ